MKHLFLVLLFSLFLLVSAPFAPEAQAAKPSPQSAAAQTASQIVSTFYAELTDAMKKGKELGFAGRFAKLEPAVKKAFDLPLMTRYAVGFSWAKATPEEQQKLTTAFSRFSTATYASRFSSYDGEVFEVTSETQLPKGDIMVNTKLIPSNGEAVALNYLLRKDSKGDLKIVDVFLNASISELATRRADFGAVIKRDGLSGLITQLDNKVKAMETAAPSN